MATRAWLSVAYRIVDLHGGRIEVTSEPGQGATVVVRLRPAGTLGVRAKPVSGAMLA